ncbi:hypothetical protein GCM10023259_103850 [Thermocatellispora tengchongensis]
MYAADLTGTCRVTHPFPGGVLDDAMVAHTREILTNVPVPNLPLPGVSITQPQIGVSVSLLSWV